MRTSGILLPVASLPGNYGIGGFSEEAYRFVDFLAEAGQRWWQILPLGPTGYGDSPYQSFSTYAGNPYYISLDELIREGLLTQQEADEADCGQNPGYVEYEKIWETRFAVLRKACGRFRPDEGFRRFAAEQGEWLEDYCLYCAVKASMKHVGWLEWPEALRDRDAAELNRFRAGHEDEIGFYRFLQYHFWKQWTKLKKYANDKGIRIIGDVPIYVAMDSADAWADPDLFQFDADHKPAGVAGCPPDAFAVTGQLWGNPLYDWKRHKETGYAWWIRRMRHAFRLYDKVRIDHFRGFESYYSIPYGDPTAEFGHWETGPGADLFRALDQAMGKTDLIAEDLGFLTEKVHELLRETGYPGMKVLQFAFDSGPGNAYLPHNYTRNCVVYTGTHDNETTLGWLASSAAGTVDFVRAYTGVSEGNLHALIRLALGSVADLAVIPMQDYLELGNEARINVPSTLGNNWKWRMLPGQADRQLASRIAELTRTYGR